LGPGEVRVGSVLGGRYRLVRKLGEGAAGAVWFAHDVGREIAVAVKVLWPKLAASKEQLARFVREADLSERMLSPHIVRVLARQIAETGQPYIVYEHLEGEDLATRLAVAPMRPLAEVESIVVHACRGLARAHAIGVLHRDIKPENLFMMTNAEGRLVMVKILDFGVAELVREGKRDEELVGTYEYMAPEVLMGERPAEARSDLYSVGVVAYEACTGLVPFRGDGLGQLVVALSGGRAPPIRERREDLGADLDDWFGRALHRDPTQRWESAKQMAEAFHVAVKLSERKRPPGAPRAGSSPMMRPPMQSFVFEDERSQPYRIIQPREDRGDDE
jgi:eukaryotic-like serine/threonine-protein kinase